MQNTSKPKEGRLFLKLLYFMLSLKSSLLILKSAKIVVNSLFYTTSFFTNLHTKIKIPPLLICTLNLAIKSTILHVTESVLILSIFSSTNIDLRIFSETFLEWIWSFEVVPKIQFDYRHLSDTRCLLYPHLLQSSPTHGFAKLPQYSDSLRSSSLPH